jgi:hypothetical protein
MGLSLVSGIPDRVQVPREADIINDAERLGQSAPPLQFDFPNA